MADLGRRLPASWERGLVAPNQGLLHALVDFHGGFGPVLVQVAVHLIRGTLQILDGLLALLSFGLVLPLGLLHPGGGLALDGHGFAGNWGLVIRLVVSMPAVRARPPGAMQLLLLEWFALRMPTESWFVCRHQAPLPRGETPVPAPAPIHRPSLSRVST